ncbi:MAG: hypothetical protein AAGC54_15315 [Cyanobacteria bacterium P01_F01_bin.4]
MTNPNIDARLDRLEGLFASAGDMMLQTAELSRQNAQQIEQVNVRLDRVLAISERNALQIERNSQQIERNAQQLIRLENTMAQLALQSATDRAEFEAFRRTTQAALEKIDRVLDYLMQRNGDS